MMSVTYLILMYICGAATGVVVYRIYNQILLLRVYKQIFYSAFEDKKPQVARKDSKNAN